MAVEQIRQAAPGLKALFRRFRRAIAAAILLVLYALAGFVLAPWAIQREIPGFARAEFGREVSLERVEINPFALSLRVQGFSLKDTDGTRLAGLDELLVNLEVSSLLRRAWTFSELRLAGPYLNVVRDSAGAINLLALAPQAAEPEPDEGLPPVTIRQFRLASGVIDLTDRVPRTEFRTRIGPFGVDLDELSTLPDASGRHKMAITLESGTEIAVSGDVVVNPLRVAGEMTIKGPFLGTIQRYVRDQLRFEVAGGTTDIATRFALAGTADGRIDVSLTGLAVNVSNVLLSAPGAPEFLGWATFSVSGGELRWPAGEASAQGVQLAGLTMKARRGKDGAIDVVELLTPRAGDSPPGGPAPPVADSEADSPWRIRIGDLALTDLSAEFTDAGPAQPAVLAVTDFDLRLREVSNAPGARMPLEAAVALGGGGTAALSGELTALPEFAVDAAIRADGVKLAPLQPYVSEAVRVAIRDGALDLDGRLSTRPAELLAFAGDIRVRNLDTYDTLRSEKLLGWRELGLDDVELSLAGARMRVARVRLERPFARIFIAQDQSTNVGDLVVAGPEAGGAGVAAGPVPAADERPFRARIGRVMIADGEVDFTDLSLPLPFAARIEEMAGEFTTIDTRSAAPSRIRLEGRVKPYGLARVEGEARVSSPADLADIKVLFRNIEMAPLSPYAVKFAGRKIERGKVDLDLRYQFDERRMVGSNRIVIDELELGEKVPHPEAIDLPLGLAVALLKDADGRIDLDMPVTGSLDDPQFGIGSVLWKAFVNLVTKVVTSPFRLLGSLVGIESDDLGRIEFATGRADLLPPEKEKLLRVADALGRRPQIVLEVPAVVDPRADAAALRVKMVDALVERGLVAAGAPDSGRARDKRTREVLESLHQQAFPGQALDSVQARFRAPPADDPAGKPRLDELAYLDQLRANLTEVQAVGDADLGSLGAARASAIADEMTVAGKLPDGRVRLTARKDVEAREGQWVPAELGVGGASD